MVEEGIVSHSAVSMIALQTFENKLREQNHLVYFQKTQLKKVMTFQRSEDINRIRALKGRLSNLP